MNFEDIKKQIKDRYNKNEALKINLKKLKEEKEIAKQKALTILDCQDLAQKVAQGIQQHTHSLVAQVVTKCLETIFEEPYEFNIIFERKRGKTEAKLIFE